MRLVENISEKIEKTLKTLNLKPAEKIEDFILRTGGRKHRYATVCEDEKGRKFIFCARLHDSEKEKERMVTEVKLANALKKKRIKFFPKYFLAKKEKDFEWFLREYLEGEILESKKEIEKLCRPLRQNEILQICKILLQMQKLKFPFLKARELKKLLILEKEIEKINELRQEEKRKIKEILKKNRKFLIKENCYFAHGDFQIGNLLFTQGRIKVIDLESAMISNFAFDACFFWARLWREKEARRKFLKTFFKLLPQSLQKKFKILFQIDALFLGFHSFLATPREYSKAMLFKRKKYFLNLLKGAILGFDFLKKL